MSSLAGLQVLALDCQATGASPAFGHVLELGWSVVGPQDAPAEAHWIALPPGHLVPAQVRKLTGYDPRAVPEPALADHEAWRRIREAMPGIDPIPAVIHFARFELAFLRSWASRFEPDGPFPFEVVCLHEIANRLHPELPRLSLRALAGYYGFSLHLARRSRGHVEATAFVWRQIVGQLAERGIGTWADLRSWLGTRAPARPRPKKPVYPIDRDRYRSLPDAPGVYRFLRRNGDVLYVGKATSLRKRASSHFLGRGGKQVAPEMLTQVSDIAVTATASALEAALLENETIKTLRPPYNVQLVDGDAPVWYGTRDFREAAATPGPANPVGPLPSAFAVRPLAALADLLAGRPADVVLRAHAVGVSALWTPEPDVFAAGWRLFEERHARAGAPATAEAPAAAEEVPRSRALELARHLLARDATDDEADAETREDERAWDPERVARHIERAVSQAYRLYRRARWLRLVQDCDVVYREPGGEAPRWLQVRQGILREAGAPEAQRTIEPAPMAHALGSGRADAAPFDRARYDRLRILTTELKRIVRDGGEVSLWLRGRSIPLAGPRLHAVLQLV